MYAGHASPATGGSPQVEWTNHLTKCSDDCDDCDDCDDEPKGSEDMDDCDDGYDDNYGADDRDLGGPTT